MSHRHFHVFSALAALAWSSCTSAPTDKDIALLKLQGEAFMASIEHYAGQHDGAYPPSLVAAGVEAPKTRWGRWEYHLKPDGKVSVSIGDYGHDGFTLFWQPGYGWYLDR